MKLTQLSLVTALAINVAYAGGSLAPVEPLTLAPVVESNKSTTVSGKLQGYYITNDSKDSFFDKTQQVAGAATLDVTHSLFDSVKLNFSAVGYINALNKSDQDYAFSSNNDSGYFEGSKRGAFFNVANIQANIAAIDTTIIAGRQLIDSPMFGSYDWLLGPSSFEAYTVVNQSIANLALVGTYVTKHRNQNNGSTWSNITHNAAGEDIHNFAAGAVYDNKMFTGNAWYYNIDAKDYTQMYGDIGFDMGVFNIAAQVVSTDHGALDDSLAYGLKVGTEISGFYVTAAANMVSDEKVGFVDRDALYTSSWMNFTSFMAEKGEDTLSWKVGTGLKIAGVNAEVSYAGYGDEGSELDVILGYDITKSINIGAIYSLADADISKDTQEAVSTVEILGTYKF